MAEALTSTTVNTKLQQIAQRAREAPDMAFNNLAHLIDRDFLLEAFRRTRKDGAPGVDGCVAEDYAANMVANLDGLLGRVKEGRYQAPPVRRVHIPKDDKGNTRPIGIPTFEDKLLQRSVAMVLEAIYEQDFLDCSYGFRPGRSAHQALQELWEQIMKMGGGWVLDVDIQGFFDNLDHQHLRSFLDQRVKDKVLRRLLGKWMKAGVLEKGALLRTEQGTPQGGVVSPILANIYLHEVVDKWFHTTVKPLMEASCSLVRYADDLVMVFESQRDALRVFRALPKRLARFGLQLSASKTRLLHFPRPRGKDGDGETFDFLGFTHHWAKSRTGKWILKRRTARTRFSRAMKRIGEWCRENRHIAVRDQWQALTRKVRGHFNYFGITGNLPSLQRFVDQVCRVWQKWLGRRCSKAHMNWERMNHLLQHYPLPKPKISFRAPNFSKSPT